MGRCSISRRKLYGELLAACECRLGNLSELSLEIRQIVSLPKCSKLRNGIGLWQVAHLLLKC